MKYYVIEIAKGDKSVAGFAIYEKQTENEAKALFHKKLGTAYESPLFESELVMVIDEKGTVIERDKFPKE